MSEAQPRSNDGDSIPEVKIEVPMPVKLTPSYLYPNPSYMLNSPSLEIFIWYNQLKTSCKSIPLRASIRALCKRTAKETADFLFSRIPATFVKEADEILQIFRKVLKKYMQRELERDPKSRVERVLKNVDFSRSLLGVCYEAFLFVHGIVTISFQTVLDMLEVSVFDFWKQINNFASLVLQTPPALLLHLKELENKILMQSAWASGSVFYRTILQAFNSANHKIKVHKEQIYQRAFSLFFSRLIRLCAWRIFKVANACGLGKRIQHQVWEVSKYFLSEHTEYIQGNSVDLVLLCSFYAVCKMHCEIPLFTLKKKYEETFRVEWPQDINQYYNGVFVLLMKKYFVGTEKACSPRISELRPNSRIEDIITTDNSPAFSPVWITPRTKTLWNSDQVSGENTHAYRKIEFDLYAQPKKKFKFN